MNSLDSANPAWARASNVLCIRLDTVGDVLMTTPAMRALKESLPGRRLTLLTSSIGSEICALVLEIDECLVYDAPWMKATRPRETPGHDAEMIALLKERAFDGAVIFTVFSQSPLPAALLCHMAGIPLRLAHCHENPYQLLTGWVPDPEPARMIRHEVRRQLDLVATIGCFPSDERLSLNVPGDAAGQIAGILDAAGIESGRSWCVVHPGASAESRRYPSEMIAKVAESLIGKLGWQVVFTGSESERSLVDAIRGRMGLPCSSLAGQLDLAQLSALIAAAPLLVSNNTAPVHIAAATGTPVIDLYALTNPQHTPWMVPHRVLFHDVPCKYCYKSVCPEGHQNCLRLVTPEDVTKAAAELWHETHGQQNTSPIKAPPRTRTREAMPIVLRGLR